ncbi:hypothetical protein [Pontiella sp.]|uniref:hypothetical protein n=1 Tax=Pontiella sp. TaxID=2837462 RepID=UPI00356A4C7B
MIKYLMGSSNSGETLCLLFLSMCAAVTVQANALTNGNAEAGTLDGWTASAGGQITVVTQRTQSSGTVYPQEGSWLFCFATVPGSYETMEQSGSIPAGNNTLKLSGYFQSERLSTIDKDDFGEAVLQALNSSNEVVAEAVSGPLVAAQTLQWEQVAVQLHVPEEAVSWRVELRGTLRLGSYINVFYDDLQLEFSNDGISYPEWAAIHISDPGQRAPQQDADEDGLSNLLEYSGALDPDDPESDELFWLQRGSEVAETDVDLFYRESLIAIGISRNFFYTASLTNAFAPVIGRGPFVVGNDEGYEVKRVRVEDMLPDQGFFKMQLEYSGD